MYAAFVGVRGIAGRLRSVRGWSRCTGPCRDSNLSTPAAAGRGPRSNRVRSARLAWNRVCADRTPAMLYSNAIRIQLHAIGCMRDRRGAVLDAGLGTATVCARRSPQSPGRRQLGHGHGPLRPPLTRTRSSRLLVWACHCQSRWPPSELTRTRKSAGPRVARPLWARPARWRVSRSSRNHGSRFAPAK